jgi:gluconate 2-dehydrogenase alpha chain
MTFNIRENELRMSQFLTQKTAEIAKASGATITAADPHTSVVSPYLAALRRTESICRGRVGLPVQCRVQSDRHPRRAGAPAR